MKQLIIHIRLDAHKETIAVALAEAGKRSEVREYGKIANAPTAMKTLAAKLAHDGIADSDIPIALWHGASGALVRDWRDRSIRFTTLEQRDAIIEGFGVGTANTFVTAVASMFSFAIDYEWVETAPTARQPHGDHPDTDAGVPWRGGNLSFQLSKALAKIPDFPTHRNVHGLRKLCATILTQAGCSTHEIGRVTGHRTLAMIQHYTDSVGQQASAEAAMAKLELWRPKARMRPR